MDFLINDLQKIYGQKSINLESKSIAFKSKRTRNIIIISVGAIFFGGVAYYFYNRGKNSSKKECTQLNKELMEMRKENEKLLASLKKKTMSPPPVFDKKDRGIPTKIDAEPKLTPEVGIKPIVAVVEKAQEQEEETEENIEGGQISVNEDELEA